MNVLLRVASESQWEEMIFWNANFEVKWLFRASVFAAVVSTINTTPTKKKISLKTPYHFLAIPCFQITSGCYRRGYIKFLLLKNISHLREPPHKFNPHYYVEFSEDF